MTSPGKPAVHGGGMQLIFLHGTAAAGKLTTARALERLVGYPVFHNHLVVDTLTTVFPFGSEPFVRLREQFWLEVFGEAARAARSLTFTFAPESTVPAGFPGRVVDVVEGAGGVVRFVRLSVSASAQEQRIENHDRKAFHKLSDLDTLRRLRKAQAAQVEQPPVHLDIDTDISSAERSAATIVAAFGLQTEPVHDRYPR